MVKIHEYQYILEKPYQYQERDIKYESWDKYITDIMQSKSHISLPRDTQMSDIIMMSENTLIGRFYNRYIGTDIEHIATLLDDKEE